MQSLNCGIQETMCSTLFDYVLPVLLALRTLSSKMALTIFQREG